MTPFIAAAVALCVLAAALLTRVRWWPAAGASTALDALGEQLRQLKALHAGGALTDEQFAQSSAQIDLKVRALLSTDGDADTAQAERGAAPSLRMSGLLVAFLLAVAGGGYALVGSPERLALGPASSREAAAQASPESPHALTSDQVAQMVDKLAERLKTAPDDAQGWEMLARSYVVLGKHAEAVGPFREALKREPDDVNLMVDFADALAMANGRNLEGEPSELIARARKLDPRHPKALALAGSAAFDRHDYREAVRDWERLVEVETPDGPLARQIVGGIAQARELAGMPPAAARTDADAGAGAVAAAPAASASVSGTVTLAKELAGRASPDDTVFVYARGVDGSRAPLGILRKRVRDLPLKFTLDDSMAMSPESKLSSATRVTVGARISKSGNAMPQNGDLQGLLPAIKVGSSGVAIEINQEVVK